MFRLRDAIQRYREQHCAEVNQRLVAASVTTLPPCPYTSKTQRVADVAKPALSTHAIGALLKQLRDEGTTFQCIGDALSVRPTRWQQLDILSAHWQSLLAHLKTETEEVDRGPGPGRSA
ncbi:MAG: hypothetical protein ACRERX_06130 [Pseudomonas sp.]